MPPREIGDWAGALPMPERAQAIAALGVAVSAFGGTEPDLDNPEQIAKSFEAEMNKRAAWQTPRRLHWWLSPSGHWEGLKRRLSPKIAAEAWKSFVKAHGLVELQAGFASPEKDIFSELVPWLAELLWTPEARIESIFFEVRGEESRHAWHWPLRLGFLPDASSQELMTAFTRRHDAWSGQLTRPVDVAATGQGCDMLLSPLDAAETRAMVERHRVQATTIVLLDRKPFATPEHARDFLELRASARAATIASISNTKKDQTIVDIIEEISHDVSFDWAISRAARKCGGIPLIVADEEFIHHSKITVVGNLWAARLGAQGAPGSLEMTGPGIANEIRSINRGIFHSELGDASRLAEKINEGLAGSTPQPRYIGATLQPVFGRTGRAEVRTKFANAFVRNEWRLLAVNIAPRAGPQDLPSFPDERIDWSQDQQTLSIVVTAPNCDLLSAPYYFVQDLRYSQPIREISYLERMFIFDERPQEINIRRDHHSLGRFEQRCVVLHPATRCGFHQGAHSGRACQSRSANRHSQCRSPQQEFQR